MEAVGGHVVVVCGDGDAGEGVREIDPGGDETCACGEGKPLVTEDDEEGEAEAAAC